MFNPDNYLFKVAETLSVSSASFLFFCRDSAVLIFPTLLSDFKDPIQYVLGAELHKAHAPSIFLHII